MMISDNDDDDDDDDSIVNTHVTVSLFPSSLPVGQIQNGDATDDFVAFTDLKKFDVKYIKSIK